MKKRLLFIAYFYPPLGGPGVQRPIKTIKYLKKSGWEIDVLTVGDIQFHSYDFELLKESKADNIFRTNSWDFMYLFKKLKPKKGNNHFQNIYFNAPEKLKKFVRGFFPIDDKIGWFPFAYQKAISLHKKRKYDALISTIGPYTAGVLGYCLQKRLKIPFFVDYRDHWTLHSYPQYKFRLLFWHAKNIETKMLKNAHGVFVISHLMKEMMISHFGEHLKNKTNVVYNGFDEDDFTKIDNNMLKFSSPDFIIRYVGNFYGNRSVRYFIDVLEDLKQKNEIPDSVRIEFVGNYFAETKKLLKSKILSTHIKIIPQVNHKEAIFHMLTADLLLLFIPSADKEDFMTGKLFEYIRAGVPIFAMIPTNGEPAKILREFGHKYICEMEDTQSIKKYLLEFIELNKNIKLNSDFKHDFRYSREAQTKEFDQLLRGEVRENS